MLIIGIFGAPGSGKGTQGGLVSKKYGLYPISTGEIFRSEIENKTELGLKAQKYICQGKLLPDSFVIKIFSDIFKKTVNEKGYIFDGFPRTLSQAKALDRLLLEYSISIDIVFSLIVDEEELTMRLLKRGELLGRGDDNFQTIKNRLLVYREQTESVQDYYAKQKKLIKIIGKNSIDEVSITILKRIDVFLQKEHE